MTDRDRVSEEELLHEVKRLNVRVNMAENKAELLAEDIECVHLSLDALGIPRADTKGAVFSMWGRISLLRLKPMGVFK